MPTAMLGCFNRNSLKPSAGTRSASTASFAWTVALRFCEEIRAISPNTPPADSTW